MSHASIEARLKLDNLIWPAVVAVAFIVISNGAFIAQASHLRGVGPNFKGPNWSTYGVDVLFVLGGFAATQEWSARPGYAGFLWRAALRLLPAVFLALCASGVSAGLLAASGSAWRACGQLVHALPQWLSLTSTDTSLPAVTFYPQGDPQHELNGNLWVIQQAAVCALLFTIFAGAGWLTPTFTLAALASTLLLYRKGLFGPDDSLQSWLTVTPAFLWGVLSGLLAARNVRVGGAGLMLCLLVLAIAVVSRKLELMMPPCAACLVLALATTNQVWLRVPAVVGQPWLGTLLFAWPAQQLSRSLLGSDAAWLLVIGTGSLAAAACGWASWWAVERPLTSFGALMPDHASLDELILRAWRRRVASYNGQRLS